MRLVEWNLGMRLVEWSPGMRLSGIEPGNETSRMEPGNEPTYQKLARLVNTPDFPVFFHGNFSSKPTSKQGTSV